MKTVTITLTIVFLLNIAGFLSILLSGGKKIGIMGLSIVGVLIVLALLTARIKE